MRIALAVLTACTFAAAVPARAQAVYVGTADQWPDLITHPEQWRFVRDNVNGLYVNFIMMKRLRGHVLKQTARLIRNRNAFFESDVRHPVRGDITSGESPQDDEKAIDRLHAADFRVLYTSLNYGWNNERANILSTYHRMAPGRRKNLVQIGPWSIGGSLMKDRLDSSGRPSRNAADRDWIRRADGVSTDGPLGIWKADQGQVRDASISAVRFAHRNHEMAMVMLSPYGAGNKDYDASEFLAIAQDAVRRHEDANASPDIWSVFEYATAIPGVPEEKNGRAVSTTTGITYWLLYHLRDPNHSLSLKVTDGGWKTGQNGVRTLEVVLTNKSTWVDFAPRLEVKRGSGLRIIAEGSGASFKLGEEISFVGPLRLMPGQSRMIRVISNVRPEGKLPGIASLDLFPAQGPGGASQTKVLPAR